MHKWNTQKILLTFFCIMLIGFSIYYGSGTVVVDIAGCAGDAVMFVLENTVLEFVTPAKRQRVESDLRTTCTAIEAFQSDNKILPPEAAFPKTLTSKYPFLQSHRTLGNQVTTPVAYITNLYDRLLSLQRGTAPQTLSQRPHLHRITR